MSQFDFGGGFPQSPSSPSLGGSDKRAEISIRPLTIAQLIRATQVHGDAPWTIDNTQFGHFTLVAQVTKVQLQITNCVYTLDDGTGRMDARRWVVDAQAGGEDPWSNIKEHHYVRVFGSLKSYTGKRHINAQHIRPLTDHHEIFYHVLETITVTLSLEKGPPKNLNAIAGGVVQTSTEEFSDLPDLQQRIMKYMKINETIDGVNVKVIARGVAGPGVEAAQVGSALEGLIESSYIYETNPHHYHTTT
ncbi:nucleic acid-binding protein [Pluteus cervinus]|uniref:Nucleic acid-binding protein n=1 Tax=Pluteus cervinus TaxID=181527 RepID=A0ACD3BF40_9AGAR|nr:nucleic acid-binding protein [Pluteus cervinus]